MAPPDIECLPAAGGTTMPPPLALTPPAAAAMVRAAWEVRVPPCTWALRARLAGERDPQAYARSCEGRMVALARASCGRNSVRPIVGFLAAGVGKFALGRGTAYAVGGKFDDDRPAFVGGLAVLCLGVLASLGIALGFGHYITQVDPGYAHIVKAASITATALLLIGNFFRGMEAAIDWVPPVVPLVALFVGFGVMTFSLPTFVAHAKLVDGRLRVLDGTLQGHLFCMAGVGLGLGYASVSPDPATPGLVGDALIVTGTMLFLYGVGLLRCSALLSRAEGAARRA